MASSDPKICPIEARAEGPMKDLVATMRRVATNAVQDPISPHPAPRQRDEERPISGSPTSRKWPPSTSSSRDDRAAGAEILRRDRVDTETSLIMQEHVEDLRQEVTTELQHQFTLLNGMHTALVVLLQDLVDRDALGPDFRAKCEAMSVNILEEESFGTPENRKAVNMVFRNCLRLDCDDPSSPVPPTRPLLRLIEGGLS